MRIEKNLNATRREGLKRLLPLSVICLLSFCCVTVSAHKGSSPSADPKETTFDARYVLEKLHCSAFEILPPSTRLDMLDYWDADSVYKASNVMGGLSWLEKMTQNYAKIVLTPVSSLEIKILPVKKGVIAMTIYTVGDDPQAADSQVNFYDSELKELDSKHYFEIPDLKDFFDIPKGSATKMKEIEAMIPFPTIAYTASPDNDNLSARLTVEQYVNQDDWNIAKLFFKPAVTLIWHKDKYRVEK